MLLESITRFVEDANKNTKITKIIAGWNPNIMVKSTNSDLAITVKVRNGDLLLVDGVHSSDHQITLEAEDSVLERIFIGKTNPAEESIDGQLQVYGDAKDQIKLDVLTMILWG